MQSINIRDATRGGTHKPEGALDARNDESNSRCTRGRRSTAGAMPSAPCALLALLVSLTVLLLPPAIAAVAVLLLMLLTARARSSPSCVRRRGYGYHVAATALLFAVAACLGVALERSRPSHA